MSRLAVRVAAPAKINLTLHVGPRRPDGFHELDTLFQAVGLHDEVEVRLTRGGIDLEVDGPDLGPVEDNLAYRAAQEFARAVALDVGVSIRLGKAIPAGAGLGGGSSDAGAVLRALDHLTGAGLGPEGLAPLGARLGSDVPFFTGSSPLARGRGRGELLEPCRPLSPAWLVLVLPPVHVATGPAYAALARSRAADGGAVPGEHPEPEAGSWEALLRSAHNDFQEVVAAEHPAVAGALAALREVGTGPVLLSGSGGACFGWVGEDGEEARARAAEVARRLGWRALAVPTLEAWPGVDPVRASE